MVNLIKFCDAIIFHRVMGLYSCTGVNGRKRTYLISPQGGLIRLNLAYETYHTRILFFERYVGLRTLTYSILAYTYPRALVIYQLRACATERHSSEKLINEWRAVLSSSCGDRPVSNHFE